MVDHPAVPQARFLLIKRDALSESVRKALDGLAGLSKDDALEVIRLAKAQYDPNASEQAGNGGVEPETSPEQHVQALIDMMDELPEDALDHVIALADAAGIEVDDLPSVQGGDADQMDSVAAPQEATGAMGAGGKKPSIQEAMAAIHEHMSQTEGLHPKVKDALSTIHQSMAGVSPDGPGVATDDQEGAGGSEEEPALNQMDDPEETQPLKGPTDKDGQGKPAGDKKPGAKDDKQLDGNGIPKPPKPADNPGDDRLPGVQKKPVAPPKASVSGTPGKRRDPRVEAMLARRKAKMPVAKRDIPEPLATSEPAVPAQPAVKPVDFMDELNAELLKRDQHSEETALTSAIGRVLQREEQKAEQIKQLQDRLHRASGGRC